MTPAEEKAERLGLPVVRLLPHDALAVLRGSHMIVSMPDGGEALVRLYTAEEWLPLQHAAVDTVRTDIGVADAGEKVDRARAEELTRPLFLGGAR